jgi:hypothetical protein
MRALNAVPVYKTVQKTRSRIHLASPNAPDAFSVSGFADSGSHIRFRCFTSLNPYANRSELNVEQFL